MKRLSLPISLILIVALSFLVGRWSGDKQPARRSEGGRKILYYVDPMNPAFKSDKPGVAPCGMLLEPVYDDASKKGASAGSGPTPPGAVKIDAQKQQTIGVRTAVADVKPLTSTLRLYGRVVPDETRIFKLNSSTDCWIRTLSDITTGSMVAKNEILAEALAPAYYNAQQTYLITLDTMDRIRKQLGPEVRPQQGQLADNQMRLAVQGLQNLGITDAQVEELSMTKEARPFLQVRSPVDGVVLSRNISLYQWFKAADEFYTIADLARVWVYADVYENEAIHFQPGAIVEVIQAGTGQTFEGRVGRVLPLVDPVARTTRVRVEVDNADHFLRPDMFVEVKAPISFPPALTVPVDALIDSGALKLVYIESGDGLFEPRRVDTGRRLGKEIEITGGIMAGEKVVVSGNFLIDSESRLRVAVTPVSADSARDPVCGMYLNEPRTNRAAASADYNGQTIFFCSQECKQAFEKEPGKFRARLNPGGRPDRPIEPKSAQGQSRMDMNTPQQPEANAHHNHRAEQESSPAKPFKSPASLYGPERPRVPRKTAEEVERVYNFPGANYLGVKTNTRQADLNEDEPDSPAEAESHGSSPERDGVQKESGPPPAAPGNMHDQASGHGQVGH